MSFYKKLIPVLLILLTINGCNPGKEEMKAELEKFIKDFDAKVPALSKEANLAYFNATISGKDEDYQKSADLQVKLTKMFADKEDFKLLAKIYDSGLIEDELLKRQLTKLYLSYKGSQIDDKKIEEMVNLSTQIEQKYSTYRAVVNDTKLTDNSVEEILKTSTNLEELKEAWMSHKAIGPTVVTTSLNSLKCVTKPQKNLAIKIIIRCLFSFPSRILTRSASSLMNLITLPPVFSNNSKTKLTHISLTDLKSKKKNSCPGTIRTATSRKPQESIPLILMAITKTKILLN